MKPASPMKSARRSFTQRMAAGAGATEVTASIEKDVRPPLYVPSKRDPHVAGRPGLRDSMNSGEAMRRQETGTYQPKTSFSYVPSAE